MTDPETALVFDPNKKWNYLDCLPLGKWCLVIVSLSDTQSGTVEDVDWKKMWGDFVNKSKHKRFWNKVGTHQDNLEFKSHCRTIITRNDVERIIDGVDGNNLWKSVEKGRPKIYHWLVLRDAILVIKLKATTKPLSKNMDQFLPTGSLCLDWLENSGNTVDE